MVMEIGRLLSLQVTRVLIMHRFYVAPECIGDEFIEVGGQVANQSSKVLRLQPRDQVAFFDNSGYEYIVELISVTQHLLNGRIVHRAIGSSDPRIHLTLYQGIMKANKFETVLQKGTEIGISSFVPVLCSRSVPSLSRDWVNNRYLRWSNIIVEASEQSGRTCIPTLEAPMSFQEAIVGIKGNGIMAWEGETDKGLRECLVESIHGSGSQNCSLFVGPEGGFAIEEVQQAKSAGFVTVNLGKRILRAETAGLAMAMAAMYEFGELGN